MQRMACAGMHPLNAQTPRSQQFRSLVGEIFQDATEGILIKLRSLDGVPQKSAKGNVAALGSTLSRGLRCVSTFIARVSSTTLGKIFDRAECQGSKASTTASQCTRSASRCTTKAVSECGK